MPNEPYRARRVLIVAVIVLAAFAACGFALWERHLRTSYQATREQYLQLQKVVMTDVKLGAGKATLDLDRQVINNCRRALDEKASAAGLPGVAEIDRMYPPPREVDQGW